MGNIDDAELEKISSLPDKDAQPGPDGPLPFDPTIEGIESVGGSMSDVYWPTQDSNTIDYAYLASENDPEEFELNFSILDRIISLNSYEPDNSTGKIVFALRGAKLEDGNEVENVSSVELKNVRPDHRNFRCVLGFYDLASEKLSVFTGSTVPCRRAVWGYANGGDRSNMLPTGMHPMYIWRHKTLRPALRMSESNSSNSELEQGGMATVLRNTNDLSLGTKDDFDPSRPLDNVHCSYFTTEQAYYGAYFSSWGCLTVRGKKDPTDQWKKFQSVLSEIGAKQQMSLLLATGKDAAIISAGGFSDSVLTGIMGAMRRGSTGNRVKALQQKLGITEDGDFGPNTLGSFSAFQRSINEENGKGKVADGVYSKSTDAETGWNLFDIPVGT